MSTSSRSSKASKAGEINLTLQKLKKSLELTPEEKQRKNEEKYTSIRKVLTLMIHCVDCDDEECALMPYCLDYQDLLVHMEECCDKKCRLKVSPFLSHVCAYGMPCLFYTTKKGKYHAHYDTLLVTPFSFVKRVLK